MPIAKKRTLTSPTYSSAEVAAAKASAPSGSKRHSSVDWSSAVVTPGGGVEATISAIRRTRGPGKKPSKEQVAIRLDPDIIGAFKAGGPGWQTRMNAALKEWLSAQPPKRKSRRPGAG
ncbi:MAG: BrnA antitoxin family protein [Burkholderiales bacterium]|nr:BrnA antitoxin family protein [Burkholderiales bacterium]